MRGPLYLGEPVFVLADRLKKKDVPGKLCKISIENKPCFNKNKFYINKNTLFKWKWMYISLLDFKKRWR